MRDTNKIIDVSVTTTTTRPLCGIVEIETTGSTMKFELTEEIASAAFAPISNVFSRKSRTRTPEVWRRQ